MTAAQTLFPASGAQYGCGDTTGDYAACPVSPRLEQRLTALYGQAPYRPMCRCSLPWSHVVFQVVGSDTVDVTFNYPPNGYRVTMVVSMVTNPSGSGWVADDTSCSADSIYTRPQPTACYMQG